MTRTLNQAFSRSFGRLRVLNFIDWPLRTKIAVALTATVLLPLLLAFVTIQPDLRELSLQSLRSFVSENGERQRQAVTAEITRARASLDTFAGDAAYARRLTTVLLRDSSLLRDAPARLVDPDLLSVLFSQALLNPSTTLFRNVRLLDRDGHLITTASVGGIVPALLQDDQSPSTAYRDAVNERLVQQGRDQLATVTERDGQPVIDLTRFIRWRDGSAMGYLIAELDVERIVETALSNEGAAYPASSFILSNNHLLFSPAATLEQATLSSASTGAQRALAGEVGLDLYRLGQTTEQVVGYYAPLPDLPLVIVSEVPDSAAAASVNFVDARVVLIILLTLAFLALLVIAFNQWVARPLLRLNQAVSGMAAGDFSRPVSESDIRRADEIGVLATSLDSMRRQTQATVNQLETRINALARDMSATQDIGRYAVSQRDVHPLMHRVVNLIVERFPGIYHAQIFLVDADRRWALLRASTGEPGQHLLARGHRFAVGSVSVIGQVSQQGRVVLARDTDTQPSQGHQRNEFLPDTRAELAIPLRIDYDIIGVLDVQSQEPDAFGDDLTGALETLADQIAIAIQNARLYPESMQRMSQIERDNRAATQSAWRETMRDQHTSELASEAGVRVADLTSLRQQAMDTGRIAVGEPTDHSTVPIAVPVILRGQTLGAVEWEIPANELDDNKLQLAQELANRLAISLDNARLFEESRRATERERVVNTIAARLTAHTTVDDILQTAVREVGQALRAPQVVIRMQRPEIQSEIQLSQTQPEVDRHTNGHENGNSHLDSP